MKKEISNFRYFNSFLYSLFIYEFAINVMCFSIFEAYQVSVNTLNFLSNIELIVGKNLVLINILAVFIIQNDI